MIEVPEGKGKGHWQRILVNGFEENPYWSAVIWCPSCAKPLSLVLHSIADNGQVSPSVGHPVEYPPCDWHVTPRLIGWQAWPAPPKPVLATCERCGMQTRQIGGWGTWSGGGGIICPECIKAHNRECNHEICGKEE